MKQFDSFCLFFAQVLVASSICTTVFAQQVYPSFGSVVYDTPAMEKLVPKHYKIEVLTGGFIWSEGPVWSESRKSILFSDVPKNTVYEWSDKQGLSVFLNPSGYTGRGTYGNEPGSNGLTIDKDGNLILAEHGDRRISKMPLENGGKVTLASDYQGKRFNSPNDVVQHPKNNEYYFTDPPYGLPKKENDSTRELSQFGVYRIKKQGGVELLINDLTRPNGLAFSPDGSFLYVAISDPQKPYIMRYKVLADGNTGRGELFYNTSNLLKEGHPGLPDGLKVDQDGNIWTTGPGGVLVLSPGGKLIGRILTGRATANCAWGDDGSTLYMTAHQYLIRIKTTTKGANWK